MMRPFFVSYKFFELIGHLIRLQSFDLPSAPHWSQDYRHVL